MPNESPQCRKKKNLGRCLITFGPSFLKAQRLGGGRKNAKSNSNKEKKKPFQSQPQLTIFFRSVRVDEVHYRL
jgi:hypothetical protein